MMVDTVHNDQYYVAVLVIIHFSHTGDTVLAMLWVE